MWRVEIGKQAYRQLKKLDPSQRRIIESWLKKNIDGCDDPRAYGHALHYDRRSLWRYRVGKYRVICEIRDAELLVLAVEVGHRAQVYR